MDAINGREDISVLVARNIWLQLVSSQQKCSFFVSVFLCPFLCQLKGSYFEVKHAMVYKFFLLVIITRWASSVHLPCFLEMLRM